MPSPSVTPSPEPASTCPRCGVPLHPHEGLHRLALQISQRSAHGLEALENRRLAVPTAVSVALQEAKLDCRILANRLACHAGLCERSASGVRAGDPGSRAALGESEMRSK